MKIALAQINTMVGAISDNAGRIVNALERARDAGADLVVFPELTIPGYPPLDLLDRESFIARNLEALDRVAEATRNLPAAIVGFVRRDGRHEGKGLLNAAALCAEGRIVSVHDKSLLPTYDVFDEMRYFDPALDTRVAVWNGTRIGISICEDIWNDTLYWKLQGRRRLYSNDPIESLVSQGAEILVNIAASPFTESKRRFKNEMFAEVARRHRLPLIHVNLVGGNDSLVFEGASNVFDSEGHIVAQARDFAESLLVVDTDNLSNSPMEPVTQEEIAGICEALTLGIRDYVGKCGFKSIVVGLSGGIDSAVTAALAVRALGASNVTGVAMPSEFSSDHSIADAKALAENLGIRFHVVHIRPAYRTMLETMEPLFEERPFNIAEENLQARIRGNILMALSNKFGHLVLSTGNKSEMAVGYCTLYGDMSGGLAVLSDVPKTLVYALAEFLNRSGECIPVNTIAKPPSAELRPDQLDSDSLPPYEILDPILRAYIEEGCSKDTIVERGFERPTVERVLRMIDRNEYKRQQAAVGIKITHRAFGYGRRMPIARGLDD
jgi:NAD+ synthase (glutamine-hydrolysing)